MKDQIEQFLQASAFGVVGASTNRRKFGNKILRCYLQHHKKVYPINPAATHIEGLVVIKDVCELPAEVTSISIITPPIITEPVVEKAIAHGIKNIWLQSGAESITAINLCKQHSINVIANGQCLLQYLGFTE